MPNTIRVYPDGDVWVVKKDGNSKASAIRDTQREAYLAAREIALNQGLSITVHGPNGQIQKVVNPQDRASNDGCFITTACVKAKGLPDNCYELETLRKFREEYVRLLPEGSLLLKQYKTIAPQIVKLLKKQKDKKMVYDSLYVKISLACIFIERNENEKAFEIYCSTVRELSSHFDLSE
ncbi:MAG: DUF2188 domain-containing protein [Bacteroidia bacterium]|nr:DUF2188 domain-containing protein [Bacteroidia bacterium]